MTDVMLFQSLDGGDLELVNGVITLDESPFSAIYLSLFGGNTDDLGTSATKAKQWWGNTDEPEPTRHMRSKTQALLVSLPAVTSNLIRIQEAAESDLAWLTDEIAEGFEVIASLPARNTVRILIQVTGRDGTPYQFRFDRPWGLSQPAS